MTTNINAQSRPICGSLPAPESMQYDTSGYQARFVALRSLRHVCWKCHRYGLGTHELADSRHFRSTWTNGYPHRILPSTCSSVPINRRLPTPVVTCKKRWRRESNPCARLCRPLPHHSATPPRGLMRLHLRADDGIRTRDPHLGKVMRYQLRYIRAPRARCRHVRTETIVHPSMATQISLRLFTSPITQRILAETAARVRVRPRSPTGSWLGARSRGSVGERPLHTRKVAGSIPAGTTRI